MTVTVSFPTVANSIAGLSVSGVNIKDIDEIPDSANGLCPLLMPSPNNFISEIAPTRESFGGGGTALMNFSYVLNYVYLHCEVGSGINAYAPYAGLMTNLKAIIEKIMTSDNITGAVDMELGGISNVGIVTDPTDTLYWGVQFSFRVKEHAQ